MQRFILVVDDDATIRHTLADLLELEGHRVVQAQHGRHALQLLEELRPDVILTDMRMPEMDGEAFVRAYRAGPGPHAPIICMTAAADAARRCREVAADGCLPKPFDLDDVLACVERPYHRHPQAA